MIRRISVLALLGAGTILTGVSLAFVMLQGLLPNAVYSAQLTVDRVWVVSAVSLNVGMGITAAELLRWWIRRANRQAVEGVQVASAAERRRFVSRLDHEIKNPLTIIMLSLANLQDPHLTDEQETSLARATQQVQRLQKLIADLRWLAELDDRTIERTSLDLQEIVADALNSCFPEGNTQEIRLHFQEVPWPVSTVRGDRDLLVTAVRNLLENASKFTPEYGQIEIRATDDGHLVLLEVADTGMGIPVHELDKIFGELYRGSNAAHISGTGMGLALVERIVTLHGGTLIVRSREGHGTVITITLPTAPSP